MSKGEKKSKFRLFLEWCGIVGGAIALFAIPVGVALFINNKQHQMEIIELQQQHNRELQRQHDEFEEKISEVREQLEDCKHKYRLLEIDNMENRYGK